MEFMERVQQLIVRSSSPDRRIVAKMHSARHLEIEFANGAFRQYREPTLEHQLGALATRLWTEYQRDYLKILSDATGEPVVRSNFAVPSDLSRDQKQYREGCARIVSVGDGYGGQIIVTSTGLVRWEFSIQRGLIAQTDEAPFCRELLNAAQTALNGHFSQAYELKNAIYGDPRKRTELGPWLR